MQALITVIKKTFGITDLHLFLRKKKQKVEKVFYKKKYTISDIIEVMRLAGIKPGHPLVLHSAFGSMYNFVGSPDDLIDGIIDYLGPDGTLCMPAYPHDKTNNNQIFDINRTPSAAGYLTEIFRKRQGVKRSMNQLHSVCALGKDADYITSEHHKSVTCFDEHSPYYIIGKLKGYSMSIGMPKWFVGTGEHVCESLLYGTNPFFTKKFEKALDFKYLDYNGDFIKHKMYALPHDPDEYIRAHDTAIFDNYFDKNKFKRIRLSNIWICICDMEYLYTNLMDLAQKGIYIYKQ